MLSSTQDPAFAIASGVLSALLVCMGMES